MALSHTLEASKQVQLSIVMTDLLVTFRRAIVRTLEEESFQRVIGIGTLFVCRLNAIWTLRQTLRRVEGRFLV